jgi:hypothetical protein
MSLGLIRTAAWPLNDGPLLAGRVGSQLCQVADFRREGLAGQWLLSACSANVPSRPLAVAHGRQLAGELKIIAAILELPVIEKILTHLGLQARAPARGQALQVA